MPNVSEILLSTIEDKRPLVLLLGEDAWSEPAYGDPLLKSVFEKLGRVGDFRQGWSGMLSGPPLSDDRYSWLADRFERRVHPPFIEILSELPWSAVFTSSVDPTLVKLFSNRGREVAPILTAEEDPSPARSTKRPPLYYLFSRAGEQDTKALPPADRMGLRARRTQHAIRILDRIRETATPLGTIVVDGFVRADGWLNFESLIGTLSGASMNQVLWFGGRPDLSVEDDADFASLQNDGRLVIENRRLGTVVAELKALGLLKDTFPLESDDPGTVSFGARGSYQVPPEVRLRVEAVASIVDDTWTSFLPPLGPDAEYDTFRRFHGALGGPRLLVDGVRRGYAIKRDFETDLFNRVSAALDDHAKLDAPIMVEGQSGTGKSVALARLVANVRTDQTAAVLYAIGRIPKSDEVEYFCQEAERSQARVTLIVCDANSDIDSYDELLSGLRSRGRRVVVLGSQYRTGNPDASQLYARIEAPASFSKNERLSLGELLREFKVDTPIQLKGEHFLATLYRYLPASRFQIGSGLSAEARSAVQHLGVRGTQPQAIRVIGAMQQAMIDAGLMDRHQQLFDDQSLNGDDDGENPADKVINMVMVAGRLNCPIPFNLLLRALNDRNNGFDSELISYLFGDLDLIRWESRDTEGNDLVVLPRLPLEAQLICERRLGSPQAEAGVILELIGAVRMGIDGEHEREFLLHLLQQIGRNGPRGNAYKQSYMDFARKLTELRNRFNIVDASLMLQESVFRRGAVRENEADNLLRFELLDEARNAIQTALDAIDDGKIRPPRRTRQNLRVERATLFGFLAYDSARRSEVSADIWSAYEAARVAVRAAVSAADNYYPHDVGLWTPAHLLKSADLTEVQQAELAADIYSTLGQVERESLPPSQKERFQQRRMTVGNALQDHTLTDNAYLELENSGSTAGYFLRARQLGPELNHDDEEVTDSDELKRAKRAADFLAERLDKIENDERCLWLLLENRWLSELRRRPLRGERQPLPMGDTRRRFLNIVRALNVAAGESARYGTRYLEAVLTWLAGNQIDAGEIFRQLYIETDNVYRGRIFMRHTITDHSGRPERFTGRVENSLGAGRWRLKVSGFEQTIALLERDFPRDEIRYGRSLSGFSIAFNFIGPIADPLRRRDEFR